MSDTNDNTKEQEYRFRVILKRDQEYPVFFERSNTGMHDKPFFEAAGWDTWDEMPGFVMFLFDNDDTVLMNKDNILSISIIPKNP